MERNEQQRFVEEICDGLKQTLLTTLPRVPETWDGIELRRWLVDKAAELYIVSMGKPRLQAYQNDVLVENL